MGNWYDSGATTQESVKRHTTTLSIRDEEYISKLEEKVTAFVKEMKEMINTLTE